MILHICMFFVCLFVCVCFFSRFQHFFGQITAVGPPNRLSWITNQWVLISPQVSGYKSHMIFESAVRHKRPLDLMSKIDWQREIAPRPMIKTAKIIFNRSCSLCYRITAETISVFRTHTICIFSNILDINLHAEIFHSFYWLYRTVTSLGAFEQFVRKLATEMKEVNASHEWSQFMSKYICHNKVVILY